MTSNSRFLFSLLLFFIPMLLEAQPVSFSVKAPDLVLGGIDFTLEISAVKSDGSIDQAYSGIIEIEGIYVDREGEDVPVKQNLESGRAVISDARVAQTGNVIIRAHDADVSGEKTVRSIPGILSILPPLLAIALAILLRQVIISLFTGVWLGAIFVFDYDPFTGFLRVLDHYIVTALATPDHISIIAFSMLFGGMVGVISKNGGTYGIADVLIRMAKTPKGGQIATWLLGIVIFFDDYANTLIVGNTMRPITDKLRISREKLAYIVDSTAAPVSSLFFISTWIGYEVGLIDAAITSIGYHVENAYWIFIDTIPYRFYPIFTLMLGFMISASGRDFGFMLKSERRARSEGKVFRDGAQLATDLTDSSSVMPSSDVPYRWWNAAIPILTIIVVALVALYSTGVQNIRDAGGTDFSFGNIIGQANSYKALLWASLLSCFVAIVLSVSQRILTLVQAMDAWFNGLKSMLLAMLILTLAWSIGAITLELHTAPYLAQILKGSLLPQWLPVLTFLVAAFISFSTGTSWGTMGIMMPIVIPLAAALSKETGFDVSHTHIIMLGTISSVLAGSVFGDHCSPISDTTILSSMASACDHIDHVRTQLPYALLAAFVGMLVGDIPTAFGLSPYISLVIGFVVIAVVLRWIGKRS